MPVQIENSTSAQDPATPIAMRQKLLLTVGLGFVGLIRAQDVSSMTQEGDAKVHQTVSEHARRESLPADAFDLPCWVPDHTGPFDLSDPLENHFAFAKA